MEAAAFRDPTRSERESVVDITAAGVVWKPADPALGR
jgi:hypothetical protein